MQLTVERDALNTALGRIAGLVKAKESLPILGHMRLSADDAAGRLWLSATDLDAQAVEGVDAQVAEGGDTLVPGKALREIVRRVEKGAELGLSLRESDLRIAAGRSHFTLPVLPAGDFPELAPGDIEPAFATTAGVIKALLARVGFAAGNEETRYYLCGVHLVAREDGCLRAVATDGHRLALSESHVGGELDFAPATIPNAVCRALAAFLEEDGAEVEVAASAQMWRFTRLEDGGTFTTKLIDGTFPDYQRVIPQRDGAGLSVETDEITRAAELVGSVGADALQLDFDKAAVHLAMRHVDRGEGATAVPASYDGKPVTIGVNPKYLTSALGAVCAPRVKILPDPADVNAPLLLKPESGDVADLFVVMPMRLSQTVERQAA